MRAIFPEGNGIFETLKTFRGTAFALSRHIARATRSASILGMSIPSEEQIRDGVAGVLSKTPSSLEFGRLRISFHASGEFELLHETYHPWTSAARLTLLDRPINESAPLIGLKTLPYSENIGCLQEAQASGFDDGIRFNFSGEVCEGAVTNLLLKIGGQWVTPHVGSGCLPGITRELALQWLDIQEAIVPRQELRNVESMYLLSSLKEAQPVAFLGATPLEIDTEIRRELLQRMAKNVDP